MTCRVDINNFIVHVINTMNLTMTLTVRISFRTLLSPVKEESNYRVDVNNLCNINKATLTLTVGASFRSLLSYHTNIYCVTACRGKTAYGGIWLLILKLFRVCL